MGPVQRVWATIAPKTADSTSRDTTTTTTSSTPARSRHARRAPRDTVISTSGIFSTPPLDPVSSTSQRQEDSESSHAPSADGYQADESLSASESNDGVGKGKGSSRKRRRSRKSKKKTVKRRDKGKGKAVEAAEKADDGLKVQSGSSVLYSTPDPDLLSTPSLVRSTDVDRFNSSPLEIPPRRPFHPLRPRSYSADSESRWVIENICSPFGQIDPENRSRMLFSEKRAAGAHRRRANSTSAAAGAPAYDTDLTSRDRGKQKEAIRKILSEKVKNDWEYQWPRQEGDPEPPVVDQNIPTSELEWTERYDWITDGEGSDTDEENDRRAFEIAMTEKSKVERSRSDRSSESSSVSARHGTHMSSRIFGLDSSTAASAAQRKLERRRAARRKKHMEDSAWNDGLRCFTTRRDLWTGARYVRRATTRLPPDPHLNSAIVETPSHTASSNPDTVAARNTEEDMVVQIPIAPPILPPETLMRRALTEKAYPTIYDKIVLQQQTPFCPINLSTMVKSCVEGWKRDGEWPPKMTEPEAAIARKATSSTSKMRKVLSRSSEKTDAMAGPSVVSGSPVDAKDKGVFRRSFQKVLSGLQHHSSGSPGGAGGSKDVEMGG